VIHLIVIVIVIVIDNDGRTDVTAWGGIMTRSLRTQLD